MGGRTKGGFLKQVSPKCGVSVGVFLGQYLYDLMLAAITACALSFAFNLDYLALVEPLQLLIGTS